MLAPFGFSTNSPQAAALWGQLPPELQSLLRTMGIRGFTDYDVQSLTLGVIAPTDWNDPSMKGMLLSFTVESPTLNLSRVCAEIQTLVDQNKKKNTDVRRKTKKGWTYWHETNGNEFIGFAIRAVPNGINVMMTSDRSQFSSIINGRLRMAKENHPLAAAFIDGPDYISVGINGYAPIKKSMCRDQSEAEVEAGFADVPWVKEIKGLSLILPYDANNVGIILATGFKNVAQAQAMQAMISQLAPNLAPLGLTIPAGQITNVSGLQTLVYSMTFTPEELVGLIMRVMAAQQGGAPGQNGGDDFDDDFDVDFDLDDDL